MHWLAPNNRARRVVAPWPLDLGEIQSNHYLPGVPLAHPSLAPPPTNEVRAEVALPGTLGPVGLRPATIRNIPLGLENDIVSTSPTSYLLAHASPYPLGDFHVYPRCPVSHAR